MVGAGPAGLSSCLGLLRLGFEVEVFEQRAAGSSRVCGSYLNRTAVSQLKWLGVLEYLEQAGAVDVPKTHISFLKRIQFFLPSKWRQISAKAIPRPQLENCLARKAGEEGAALHFSTCVLNIKKDHNRWIILVRNPKGHQIPHGCDLLVLADGRFSMAHGPHKKTESGWFGWNATFAKVPQAPGEQSMYFFPDGYVGVVTYADGSSNVCGLINKQQSSTKIGDEVFLDAMSQSDSLSLLLTSAQRTSEWRGVGPLNYSTQIQETGKFILAGDAAAVGDPFMGEGIGRALGAGSLLVKARQKALKRGDRTLFGLIRSYNRLWNRRYRAQLLLGKGLRWGLSIFSKRINLWKPPPPTETTPSKIQKSASDLSPTPSSTTRRPIKESTNS